MLGLTREWLYISIPADVGVGVMRRLFLDEFLTGASTLSHERLCPVNWSGMTIGSDQTGFHIGACAMSMIVTFYGT